MTVLYNGFSFRFFQPQTAVHPTAGHFKHQIKSESGVQGGK